jgi:hypothetical protein
MMWNMILCISFVICVYSREQVNLTADTVLASSTKLYVSVMAITLCFLFLFLLEAQY